MGNVTTSLTLTPRGRLLLDSVEQSDRLALAFERGTGHGLLHLGVEEPGTLLPADLAYWRDFGARFVTAVCAGQRVVPHEGEMERMLAAAPPMTSRPCCAPA